MRIAILHPDLGLGGAERLIVDAAYSLARNVGIFIFLIFSSNRILRRYTYCTC